MKEIIDTESKNIENFISSFSNSFTNNESFQIKYIMIEDIKLIDNSIYDIITNIINRILIFENINQNQKINNYYCFLIYCETGFDNLDLNEFIILYLNPIIKREKNNNKSIIKFSNWGLIILNL